MREGLERITANLKAAQKQTEDELKVAIGVAKERRLALRAINKALKALGVSKARKDNVVLPTAMASRMSPEAKKKLSRLMKKRQKDARAQGFSSYMAMMKAQRGQS